MALHTSTQIRIEGHEGIAETFQLLALYESIGSHHRFELELPSRRFGQGRGTTSWRALLGQRIYIEITAADENLPYGPKIFSGLITGLSLAKTYGPHGSVVLKGGSPTLLLDDDPHMDTFNRQSLQRIVEQQLSDYPANLLRPQINPANTEPLEYKVQYKENTWQLLQRLASEYGEWLFYDGQQLIFGRYNPNTLSLTHDLELDQFTLQLGVQPAHMELAGYDYTGDQSPTSDSASHLPSEINAHSRTVLETSQSLFMHQGRYKPNRTLNGNAGKHMNQIASRQSASAVAGMVSLNGSCQSTGIRHRYVRVGRGNPLRQGGLWRLYTY